MNEIFVKNKTIDKRKKEIKISEVIKRGLLPVSKETIHRWIEKTKWGELDFPFRQYTPKGDYYIPVAELEKWIRSKSGKSLT